MFRITDIFPELNADIRRQQDDSKFSIRAEDSSGRRWFSGRTRWFRRDFGQIESDIEEKDRPSDAAKRGGPVGRKMPVKAPVM